MRDPLELALKQLRSAGVRAEAVCVALPDSIVFWNTAGRVCTAWTKAWPSGKVEVLSIDPGMPAWPSLPKEEA